MGLIFQKIQDLNFREVIEMPTPFEQLNGFPENRSYTKEEIKTVCMWCGEVLNNPNGIVVSHGICQPCLKAETEKMDITVEDFGAAANG